MFGDWQSWIALVVAILIAYGVVLWLGIIVWTHRDIRERTRDGWSEGDSVLLVTIFNVPGLFLYLILRPHETLGEAYERRMEAELLMRDAPNERPACPTCRRAIKEDFLMCPYCRTSLRAPCLGCGRALELSWVVCPYCSAQGPQARVAAPPSAVSTSAPPPAITPSPPAAPSEPPSDGGAPAPEHTTAS